jgi:peptide/nickel transport system ATP-binding protein
MMTENMLEVRHLKKYFPIPQGLLGALLRQPPRVVHAVDDVSFTLKKGEILALVGESGCGKTTTAITLLGLTEPTGGDILFNDQDITPLLGGARAAPAIFEPGKPPRRLRPKERPFPQLTMKKLRQQVQMVFQDPYESLNPRATIFQIVAEPLEVHGLATDPGDKLTQVKTALEEAGLKPAEDFFSRYPFQLSGGQRQRVVIACALVLGPQFIIADEPVSMLDVSIRAEILNLLRGLRDEKGISMLFITHDLSTAAYFTDQVAVMYLGRIVEIGPTREVLSNPKHPYTQALLSVIPVPNPRLRRKRMILQGETPNPIDLPGGCRFHPRCPLVQERCKELEPQLADVGLDHQAACLSL